MSAGAAAVARPAAGAGGWLAWAASPAALAAAWALAARLQPECALRAWTGLGCPTCGLTRATLALARGDLAGSLALHPWALPLLLQALAGWLAWGAWRAGRMRGSPERWLPHALGLNAAALLLVWLVRLAGGWLPA